MNIIKKTIYGKEAREKLLSGAKQVYDAVVTTLGPKGRNVVIERNIYSPYVTKDGVTVAAEQILEDKYENMGAQMIKQAALKTAEEAGDGTTTSIVLAAHMIQEGNRLINKGANPIDLKRGLDFAVKKITDRLLEISTKLKNAVDIKSVATIAANNDDVLGELIGSAVQKVGEDGVISVEDSKTTDTKVEKAEGMKIDKGFLSPYFITDPNKMQCVLEKPYIIIFDNKVTQMQEIAPVLEKAKSQGRPTLIISDGIENEALSMIILNHLKGVIKVAAITSPGFSVNKMDNLKDIATVTGGCIFSIDSGKNALNTSIEELGQADRIIISKNDTVIINGKGKAENIKARITEIKEQLKTESNSFSITQLKNRIAKMTGGVAILYVGAATEMELKEKKDRIDDAIQATQAAMKEGIVPGGGVTQLILSEYLINTQFEDYSDNQDIISGIGLLAYVLEKPLEHMIQNATGKKDRFIKKVKKHIIQEINTSGKNMVDCCGYNAKNMTFSDNMMKDGIIDPVKVIRCAIQNAASVAGMFFLTECVIINKDEDKTTK